MSIYNLLCGIGAIQASPGTLVNTQEFTSTGSGTWIKPGNASYAIIEIWAGGGSGGMAYNGGSFSQGGQGGSYTQYQANMSDMSATESLLVGTGGSAVQNNGGAGLPGNFSWFGEAIWAKGGYGGRGQFVGAAAASNYTPTVSRPWTLLLNETGADGGYGVVGSNGTYAGGGGGGAQNSGSTQLAGGISTYGGAGGAGKNNGTATAGSQPGGGGGASVWTAFSGAGGAGKIIVKSYA